MVIRSYFPPAQATVTSNGRHLSWAQVIQMNEANENLVRTGTLTGRQIEIVRLVAMGMSNKEIAAELLISRHTVARHVANTYERLGPRNRAGLAAYAYSSGLIPTDGNPA